MKIQSSVFVQSAPTLTSCPASELAEFAFIGRSNVGKSSLINHLTGKDLAKVSAKPGKTQLINYFLINNAWHLVDLPGYGYARVSLNQRADFNEAVADYLEKRENLRLVFVLIDSRLTPQKIDLEFIRWLVSVSVPFAFVFTKADKNKPRALAANIAAFKEAIVPITGDAPMSFTSSTKTRDGKSEILGFIGSALTEAA